MKEYKTVLILCGIIVMIMLVSFVCIMRDTKETGSERYANIYQDGQLLYSIDLEAVEEEYTIPVKDSGNKENVIMVRHGEIGIVSASCPDQLCVNMGFIHSGKLPVTCLPNQLIIKITDEADQGNEPDGVAY